MSDCQTTGRGDGEGKRASAGRHIAVNLVGETLSRLPQIAAEVTFARILGPASFGVWKSLQLMLNISNFTNLGIPAGLGKELPRAMGQDDPQQVRRMERVSLSGLAGVLAMVTAIALALAQFPAVLSYLGVEEHPGLYYLNILNIWGAQFLVNYQVSLRSRLRFVDVALGTSVFAVTFLVLGIPTTAHFGPGGIVLSYFLGCLLGILYTQVRLPYLILPGWHWPTLGLLVRMGFPLLAYGALQWLFVYTDRLLIISLLGVALLGQYGFATLLPQAMTVVSTTIPRAVLPILMRRLGADSQLSDSTPLFLVTVLALCLFNGLVIGAVLPVSTSLVMIFMPEYRDSLTTMWILLFNSYLFSLSMMAIPYSIAGERQGRMNVIAVSSLVINVLSGVWLVTHGWGIIGVATAATLGQVVFLLQIFFDVTRLLGVSTARAWRYLGWACLPGLWVLILWLAGDRVWGWGSLMTGEPGSIWTAAAWNAVNMAALGPLGLLMYRKVRSLRREFAGK